MKKIILSILGLSSTLHAADFSWTNYTHAAFFRRAYNTVICDNGDKFEVRNDRFSDLEKMKCTKRTPKS